jgi:radical SAM protein with 4Fe4S-binding SPASM domain
LSRSKTRIVDNPRKRMTVEVTSRCNYNCLHCFNRPGSGCASAGLRAERLLELVNEAVGLGWQKLLLTGGEPLCWPDFLSCYAQLHGIDGLRISVNSNASLITPDIAEILGKYPPDSFSVSLYGWDEASYDSTTRRPGSFGQFIYAISLLRRSAVPFSFAYPAVSYLVRNRDKLVSLARHLGCVRPLPRNWDLNCHAYRNGAANDRIRSLRLSPACCAEEIVRADGGIEAEVRALLNPPRRDKRFLFSCLRQYSHIVIDAEGNLLPCITLRKPGLTFSLHNASIRDGLEHIGRLGQIPRSDAGIQTRCGACRIRGICSQCPANSYLENGNLYGIADYYCQIANAEARLLGVETRERRERSPRGMPNSEH